MKRSGFKKRGKPMKRVSSRPKRGIELQADALWKRLCMDRDRDRCRRCGAPAEVVHHIYRKARGMYPKLRHTIGNGISLCNRCHYCLHFIDDIETARSIYIKHMGAKAYEALIQAATISKASSDKYDPGMNLLALKTLEAADGG